MQGSLIVKPISAKLTHNTEFFGKMDCFCQLTVGGETYKTNNANDQGKTPNWQESFTFNINQGENTLDIHIFDKDHLTPDDSVGTARIDLRDVFQRGNVSQNFPVFRKGKEAGHVFIVLEFHPSGGQGNQMGGQSNQMGVQGGFGAPMGGQMGGQGGYGAQGGQMGGQMGGQKGYGGQGGYSNPQQGGAMGGQAGYGNPQQGGAMQQGWQK